MGVVIKRTLGDRCRMIASRRHIPRHTVETIIKDYLDSLLDDADDQGRIVLDGIVSISFVRNVDTGDFSPRGRVSSALSERLARRKLQNALEPDVVE